MKEKDYRYGSRRTLVSVMLALLFLFVCYMAVVAYSLLGRQFNHKQTTYILIYPSDGLSDVETKIRESAHPTCMIGFGLAMRAFGLEDRLRAGRYEITPEMNLLTLLHRLLAHSQTPVRLLVPSVRTLPELAGRLSGKLMIDSSALATALTDTLVCQRLGFTRATMPALFVPNTYEVYWDVTVEGLLERMMKENKAFWNENREAKARQLGLNHAEVATLASIVDSETANNAEKPRIAGLYLNRLKAGMPLQSDPTVVYAVGDFSLRRVLRRHLDVDSPYNTYKNVGLPPGPIRIASVAGIDAVLNREVHTYLYMCAKEDFSGTHNFASSYAEHQQNARRYAQALNQRGIK